MTIKVLLVGLGNIGMGYDLSITSAAASGSSVRTHARAISNESAFDLVCGVDSEPARRSEFVGAYGAPAYGSLAQALQECEPDAVVIATPTQRHSEDFHTVVACKSVRTVLCEKPLAPDSRTAIEMHRVAQTNGIGLSVNYIRRACPGSRIAKEAITSDGPLENFQMRISYAGTLLNSGTHFIDLVQFWLGSPQRIDVLRKSSKPATGGSRLFVLNYPNGEVIFVEQPQALEESYSCQLSTTDFTLDFAPNGRDEILVRGIGQRRFSDHPGKRTSTTTLPLGLSRYQSHVASELILAHEGLPNALTSPDEAIENLSIIEAVLSGGHV